MNQGRDPFRIGIIGCGRISQSYYQAIEQCHGIEIAAVADNRREAADAFAEQSRAVPFYDLEDYIEKGNTQASIICTPPSSHKDISTRLLEAGQHVLCEKPLAISLEEGLQMMEIARKKSLHLTMASKFRYVGDVIRAKGIISSGLLGKVIYYENCFSSPIKMSHRWNSDPTISGGGVLVDNGTHSVDIVRYLIGPIKTVRASDLSRCGELDVEESALLSFQTVNNVRGLITLSWDIPFDRNAYLGLYGSEGRLRVNWDESSYQYTGHQEWIPFGYGYDKVSAFKRQVMNFVETIQGKADSLISSHECLASIAVVEAAYRSLKTGKWENVSEEYIK